MFFFVCDCFNWSPEPATFDERQHLVRCPCGQTMRRTHGEPDRYGFGERDKVQGQLIPQ